MILQTMHCVVGHGILYVNWLSIGVVVVVVGIVVLSVEMMVSRSRIVIVLAILRSGVRV